MQIIFNIDDKLIERVKRFFSKRNTIVIALLFVVAIATVILNAEDIKKKWHFNSGDTIYADRINENYDMLYAKVNELAGNITGATPVGAVIPFAGNEANVPQGWLLCNGEEYDTDEDSQYIELRNVIGIIYGGSGETKFRVPDLRGRVVVGVNIVKGQSTTLYNNIPSDIQSEVNRVGGEFGKATHNLLNNEMPKHDHELGMEFFRFSLTGNLSITALKGTGEENIPVGRMAILTENNTTSEKGNGDSFPIIQPSMSLNYIIKY